MGRNATACSPIQDGPQPFKDYGVDYLHSSYVDLVLSGLAGIRPQPDDSVVVAPLVTSANTSYFAVDHLLYHSKILTIIWDKDGTRYRKGAGFQVLVDGKQAAHTPTLGKLTIKFEREEYV